MAVVVADELPFVHHGVEEALDLLGSLKLLLHRVDLLLHLVNPLELVLD